MTTYEIRSEALTILAEGDDELDALGEAAAAGILTEGDAGSVAEYDGRPIGSDGVDPEAPV